MRRFLFASALLVYSLSVLGAALASRPAHAEHTDAAPPVIAPTPVNYHPIIGFAISFHHTDDVQPYLQAVDDLAALGVNSLEIVTPAFQENGGSEEVRIDENNGARRDDLIAILRHAHQRGLTTSLMPIVLFTTPRGNEWRGKIHPENWDRWWQSYRRMIDHFLAIANEAQVDSFSVGSELLSTEEKSERWLPLIAHVRKNFPGRLYYSTNWDHYHVPTFWKYLDMIGICCYWDVTAYVQDDKPDVAALAKRWREIREKVLTYGADQGRPILLTELGYPSLPWGLKDPWNYVNTKNSKAAPDVQALGYEGFLAAWGDLLSRRSVIGGPQPVGDSNPTPSSNLSPLAGVYFYSWEPWNAGDDQDTGYGVKGKPTYTLLKRWLSQAQQ